MPSLEKKRYHADDMVRIGIRFTEEQYNALRKLAKDTGRPVAVLVREGVDHVLAAGRALDVVGKFASGKNDVSRRHDRYVADAFAE